MWALRDGLEEVGVEKTNADERNSRVSTAAVWILVVGKETYEQCRAGGSAQSVPIHTMPEQQPWYRTESWTVGRWDFWRWKLLLVAGSYAVDAAKEMARLEAAVSRWVSKEVADNIEGARQRW